MKIIDKNQTEKENQGMNGTVEVSLPKSVNVSDFEIKMIIAAKLYELTKRAFLELLGKYKVSVFGYDEKELEEDLMNL